MHVRWRWPLIVLWVGLGAGCGKPAVPPAPDLARPVKQATVEAHAPERQFSASGRIKAAQRAELSFDRPDILAELPAQQGQRVAPGDVLARLDVRNLEILARAREAACDEARTSRDRLQRLHERQAIAQADLDRAQAAFEAAEANLLQVRKDLDQSTLRAPFAGRVAATLADRYQLVQARQPIAVVHDLSRFEVEIQVPETFILQVGQSSNTTINATFDQLPGRSFPVTLKEFSTEASPDTLTYAAVFTLPAPEGQVLLPGMSVSLDLTLQMDTQSGPNCWVPETAVFSDDARRSSVWRIAPDSGRVERREIQAGQWRGGFVQILGGLVPGDVVAVSGLHTLREGDRVQPYEGAPPS